MPHHPPAVVQGHCARCRLTADGCVHSPKNVNEPAEGGGTRFLQTRDGRQHRFAEVTPLPGLVLLFEHPLLHEGASSSGG